MERGDILRSEEVRRGRRGGEREKVDMVSVQ